MGDVFFSAETHFNHAKRCEIFHAVQFSSHDEMIETMIGRWNERVKKGDRDYHLGDVALGRPEDAAGIRTHQG